VSEFDFEGLQHELAGASAALTSFAQGPARRAAGDISASFERAGERIAHALGAAATEGEASFRRLAKVALEELAKIVLQQVFGGTDAAYGGASRGSSANKPAPQSAAGPVSVHFHLGPGADAGALSRHQGQIAAAIARAVAYGRRNL
jgi:hypothetical protein